MISRDSTRILERRRGIIFESGGGLKRGEFSCHEEERETPAFEPREREYFPLFSSWIDVKVWAENFALTERRKSPLKFFSPPSFHSLLGGGGEGLNCVPPKEKGGNILNEKCDSRDAGS